MVGFSTIIRLLRCMASDAEGKGYATDLQSLPLFGKEVISASTAV